MRPSFLLAVLEALAPPVLVSGGTASTSGRDPDVRVHHTGDVEEIKHFEKTKGPTDSWNELRVVCQGSQMTVFYNGEARWSCDRCPVWAGGIGLWASEGDVHFRNVEIKELPPGPPAGK